MGKEKSSLDKGSAPTGKLAHSLATDKFAARPCREKGLWPVRKEARRAEETLRSEGTLLRRARSLRDGTPGGAVRKKSMRKEGRGEGRVLGAEGVPLIYYSWQHT